MNKISKSITVIFSMIIGIVILYVILGECLLPNEKYNKNDICIEDKYGWVQVLPDGSKAEIEIPVNLDIKSGKDCVIEKNLPNSIDEDAYFIFRSSKQDVKIYIDGVLRMNYSTKSTRLFGLTSPVYYLMVKIHPEDAGKVVQIHTNSISKYSGVVSEIYYANYNGFYKEMMKTQGKVLVVSLTMIIIATMALLLSLVLYIIYKQKQKLASVSMGVLIVSAWMFCNSIFRQFVFANVSVIGDLTFILVALMPFPFATYINQIQENRYSKMYFAIKVMSVIDVIVAIGLYVPGILDLSISFYAMAIILLLLVVVIGVTFGIDAKKGYIKTYRSTALAIFLAAMVMIIQLLIYIRTDKTFDISIAIIGLLIMLIVALVDAIKDIHKMNEDRKRAMDENAAKSQFLANMSHEIRTPINAVLGMDTMILRECEDEQILSYARDIESAGKSLLSLINDILDFSKIEAGKMTLVESEYSFANILDDVIKMIRPKISSKNLKLELDIDKSIPKSFVGDDNRLKQIIINLLTNAVKYTNEGRVILQIHNQGLSSDGKAIIKYCVKDTGIGIKPEDIEKLTEKFVRIEESRNKNIEGTGLGINIVVSLLALMGSKLEVSSVYGEGSEFYFTLNQTVVDSKTVGVFESTTENIEIESKETLKFEIPDANILVVDDNRMNRIVFTGLLKELKCHIDQAESGRKCLELVQQNKYDIIFMDHMMPEMDGIETFHHMKEFGEYLNFETPVIILTANALSGSREIYMQEGFNEYVTKPIVVDELKKVIYKFILGEKIIE